MNDGKSVEDIMGSDCQKPIFMVNPLVMKFCLWFLSKEFFSSRRIIFDNLVAYTARRIDFYMFNTSHVESFYPSISVVKAISDNDSLKLEFFKHVFEQCKHVQVLNVKCKNSREVDGLVALIRNSLLNKLTMLSISETSFPPISPGVNSKTFTILFHFYHREFYLQTSKILLTNHDVLKRNPQVFIENHTEDSFDLRTLIQQHTKELKVLDLENSRGTLFAPDEFPCCPQFTHFVVHGYRIDDSVPVAFMKAVKEGKFPNLRRIELKTFKLNDQCEWPEVPEFSYGVLPDKPQKRNLTLKLTELTLYDVISLERLIPPRAERLSVVRLLIKLEKQVPQLRHLDISGNHNNEISDLFAYSSQWNRLETLATSDSKVLNVACVLLASLEKLYLSLTEKVENSLPPVTRCWWGLKVIGLESETGVRHIADGVERGMFPSVVTVMIGYNREEDRVIPSLSKLYKANISVIEWNP